MGSMIDPDSILFIVKNTPDPRTGNSRGYTIAYRPPHPKIPPRKEIVADDVGDSIAKVMEERGRKEYGGQLVTPRGDPLTEVMSTGMKINLEDRTVTVPAEQLDIRGIDERVKKNP